MIKRVIIILIGLTFAAIGYLLVAKNEKMYQFVEKYRDNYPMIRSLNPMSRLNSPILSKVTSIAIGIGLLLLAMLFVWGGVAGEIKF